MNREGNAVAGGTGQREVSTEFQAPLRRRVSPPIFPSVERVHFDLKERASEKQLSREADVRALAFGEKDRDELARENGAFAFPRERVRIGAYR